MSTQRIDYVRQNIEKFASKKSVVATSKTPTSRTNSVRVNDENRPLNSTGKPLNSIGKPLNSVGKSSSIKKHQTSDRIRNSPALERKQVKTNLVNKITKSNVLTTKSQLTNENKPLGSRAATSSNDQRRLSNEPRRLSNDRKLPVEQRRLSNEKATKAIYNDKPPIKSNGVEKASGVCNGKQTNESKCKTTSVSTQLTERGDKPNADKANDKQPHQQVAKQSVIDRPTKSQAVNLNEDLSKNRLAIENDFLKLKFLNLKCEAKLRKQHQTVIEIVRSVFDLIELKREHCLELKQQLTLKETLLFLLQLSEESAALLRGADLKRLELYLTLVSNIINGALSSVNVVDLEGARSINDVLHMTTSLLASDLKTDSVQEFSDKIKQFDVVNKEVFETIASIRTLKSALVDEVNRRTELKNIY